MEIFRFIRERSWPTLFGYVLFTGMMAVGYCYNLTFVQLGLVDLGERRLGLTRAEVAGSMAALALLTCLAALLTGWVMQKLGWSADLRWKLRLALGVALAQTALTVAVLAVRTPAGLAAWIAAASLALGVGVPATFSLTVDLVPTRDRGYTAAFITGAAYFMAETCSSTWTIEEFRLDLLPFLALGTLALGLLVLLDPPFMDKLAQQHARPEFRWGRYVRRGPGGQGSARRRLIGLLVVMFGIYFVDSLGFLRMIATPAYLHSAWQSPDSNVRLFIGGLHVLAAFAAGVLYANLDEKTLFFWIFGIFALVHLMYTLSLRIDGTAQASLAPPMLYVIAVSLYTVVNFALWADLSTPKTISLNSALGVAVSGWVATFLSTALALRWQLDGMPLERHLSLVDSLAMLFFAGLLLISLWPEKRGALSTP